MVEPIATDAHDGTGARSSGSAERELVARLLGGDERAFAELVDGLHGSLVRIAHTFVGNRAVAEEVAQETWVAVLTGLPAFERRSSLKTWIFAILVKRAKTRGEREGRYVELAQPSGDDDEPAVDPARFTPNQRWGDPPRAWDEETPERLLARRETMALLERAIAALPTTQRAVVLLRDVEGLDADEACNVLSVSETNQRVLLHRARSKLRAALEEHMGR